MKKGSGNSGSSDSQAMANFAYVGPVSTVKTTTVGQGSYENKTQVTFRDKQGGYERATATEKASAGNFQWQNGKSGTRSEYKESSTVRIGDRGGYTEVYSEQRVRNVSFNNNSGSKNVVAYDNGGGGNSGGHGYGGGGYGGYGYYYDSD